MAFDPDAYLGKKDFDPDAYLAKFDPDNYLGIKKKESSALDTAKGVGEAALTLFSGLPGQIAGGLYGLGTLASGQGLDKAADAVSKVQEQNFGLGRYKPSTDVGKEGEEKLQKLMALPGEKAGDLGE